MESISLFRTTPTQFLNKVNSLNTHSQSMVDSIATIFEGIKNNVGSLFGYQPPLKEHELNALASLISMVNTGTHECESTDGVKIHLSSIGDPIVINISKESTSRPLSFKDDTELRSFYTNCAKRYLRDPEATADGKETMNAFLIRYSTNPEDRVNAIQNFINNSHLHTDEQKIQFKNIFNNLNQDNKPSTAEKVCVNILMATDNTTNDDVLKQCFNNLKEIFNSGTLPHQEKLLLSHFIFNNPNMFNFIIKKNDENIEFITQAADLLLTHRSESSLYIKKHILLEIIYTHGTYNDKLKHAKKSLLTFDMMFTQNESYVRNWIKTHKHAWEWIKQHETTRRCMSSNNAALYNKINVAYQLHHLSGSAG